MDYQLMFPGRFLKSVEFQGKDVTLTIARVELETLEGQKGKETKGIVHFQETQKQWVINRTNAECLKGMFGRKTEGWINKRITLFPEEYHDHTGGDQTTAIRVRGSPDISGPVSVVITLSRKKPFTKVMQRTGPRAAGKPNQAPTPAPASTPAPSTEESAGFPGVES